MDLEARVRDLKEEIELMGICYNKGFCNAVWVISLKCGWYLEHPDASKSKDSAMEILQRIERHYQTIPFDKLVSNPDFYPIFVCKDLLERFGQQVREFFSSPEADTLIRINRVGGALAEVGAVYQAKIKKRIDEIRQYRGFEKYNRIVIDHGGNRFGIY